MPTALRVIQDSLLFCDRSTKKPIYTMGIDINLLLADGEPIEKIGTDTWVNGVDARTKQGCINGQGVRKEGTVRIGQMWQLPYVTVNLFQGNNIVTIPNQSPLDFRLAAQFLDLSGNKINAVPNLNSDNNLGSMLHSIDLSSHELGSRFILNAGNAAPTICSNEITMIPKVSNMNAYYPEYQSTPLPTAPDDSVSL